MKRKNISSLTRPGGTCQHPAYYNSLCVSCGEKLSGPIEGKLLTNNSSQIDKKYDLTLTGGYQLKLSSVEVERTERSKRQNLHSMRKLALILDIDHTLLHATPTSTLPSKTEMERYQLECIAVNTDDTSSKYYHLIKLRPGLSAFLEEANKNYQFSVYTNGTRTYAESVVKLIDPTGVLFRRRIMSRTDAPLPDSVLGGPPVDPCEKSLARLFVGDSSHMAVILDDREDVWRGPQGLQLLVVRPFIYFSDARDINNSSGLQPSAAVCAADAISLSGSRPGSVRRILHDGPTSAVFGQVSGYSVSAQAHFDDQLERSLAILDKIHADYYELYDEKVAATVIPLSSSSDGTNNTTTTNDTINNSNHSAQLSSIMSLADLRVESVLSATKGRVLAGCSVVFSGVIPLADPLPEQHYLWRLAVSLGAEVTLDLTPQTTHLIASLKKVQPLQQQQSALASGNLATANMASTSNGSVVTQIQRGKKVTTCISRDNVYIVHSDWLLYCSYSIARANEKTFSMIPGVPSSLDALTLNQQQQSQPSSPREGTVTTAAANTGNRKSEKDEVLERGGTSRDSSHYSNGKEEEEEEDDEREIEEEDVTVVINAEGLIDIIEKRKQAGANNNNNSSNSSSSSSDSAHSSSNNNSNTSNSKKRKSEEISNNNTHTTIINGTADDNDIHEKENDNENGNGQSNDSDDDDDDGFGDMFDRALEQNKISINTVDTTINNNSNNNSNNSSSSNDDNNNDSSSSSSSSNNNNNNNNDSSGSSSSS